MQTILPPPGKVLIEKEESIWGQKYLTAQNSEAMNDSVGQDHCRRCFLPEGLTKEVGLHSMRNKGTLCRQGKVQGKAPDRKGELQKKNKKSATKWESVLAHGFGGY